MGLMGHRGVGARRRVLVVDDSAEVRWALARQLAPDFDTVLAGGLEEAWRALAAPEPLAAVLSDLVMDGDYAGLEVLGMARVRDPATLRVLCTGSLDEATISRALATGLADRYLAKPWQLGALRELLRALQ
jgi:DNA-binding NtrC family response regulator